MPDQFTTAEAEEAITQLEALSMKPDANGYYLFDVHPDSSAAQLAIDSPEGRALGLVVRPPVKQASRRLAWNGTIGHLDFGVRFYVDKPPPPRAPNRFERRRDRALQKSPA